MVAEILLGKHPTVCPALVATTDDASPRHQLLVPAFSLTQAVSSRGIFAQTGVSLAAKSKPDPKSFPLAVVLDPRLLQASLFGYVTQTRPNSQLRQPRRSGRDERRLPGGSSWRAPLPSVFLNLDQGGSLDCSAPAMTDPDPVMESCLFRSSSPRHTPPSPLQTDLQTPAPTPSTANACWTLATISHHLPSSLTRQHSRGIAPGRCSRTLQSCPKHGHSHNRLPWPDPNRHSQSPAHHLLTSSRLDPHYPVMQKVKSFIFYLRTSDVGRD
ncbi:hypothetical protein MLD38_037933 [Melastoma candidum]|uniref:Uncharacterized protein n=1 Tax=Melastoma candidum TaxID=119954 RepID=A0ACB9KXE8_9MYRT|nr:hypothetical protein MLD38_037933 [Melastoma candidum]